MFLRTSLLLGLSVFLLCSCSRWSDDPGRRTVVKVNETELNAEEFSVALATKLKSFNSLTAKDTDVVARAKSAVVHDFIVQVITSEWASKNGLFVRKEMLDAEIEKTKKNYPDDISFRQALAQEGLSFEAWTERLKNVLLERLVIENLRGSLAEITNEDVQKYYQENKSQFMQPAASRLRQVVVGTEDGAKKIIEELRRGRKFAELAEKFSKTPEAALGGDLGWIEKGTLEVFDAALKLGVGQRSSVLKSPYGFHVIEVTARRPAKTLLLPEVEKQIRRYILQEREQALYSKWIEEQILRARVYKDEELIKQIRVQTKG